MTESRAWLDPHNQYPADDLRLVERNALRVRAWRSNGVLERTRDVIQLAYDGEHGIVVIVTADAIEVRLPTVEWTRGAYGPVASSRGWRRVLTEGVSDEELKALLEEGLEVRHAEFIACRYCRRSIPPEHRQGDARHGCAERELGHVY